MKKTQMLLFFTILVVIPLFTSCFLFDFLSPQTTSSRAKMVMTVTPQSPTYVGENMVVRISTSPSRRQEFIRLTITNLITGTSQVLEENEVSSAEFTFSTPASNFTVMAEIPGYEKRLGKEKDKSWSGLQDFTPPNVTLSVERVTPSGKDFLVEVSVDEPHSSITSVGYSLDGQTRSLSLFRNGARAVASEEVAMEIGQHVFQGFATNQNQKKGYTQNTYLDVTPPESDVPPSIIPNSSLNLSCFQDEMVTISADIRDTISYLQEVRVFSSAGARRTFEFDPLQKDYNLNYRFRVSESQVLTVMGINGNGLTAQQDFTIDVINHRAPQITLSGPEGETPAGTPLTYNFTVTAQDGVNLSEVYFLADNSTVRSFQSIGEPTFSGSVRYTVPKKDHFLKVVAIDEMGARGESDEIQITGIVEDNDPPEIQLFFPSVVYQNFDADLGFTCRDTGSGLDGYPSILIEETGKTFIPMTFDNQFFYTTWRPDSVGLYTFTVSAVDEAGNSSARQTTVEVKDPTGVLLPTISNLGAFPNPVMMGNSVQINITIVPPAQGGGVTPVVQFEVTSPTGASYSVSNITQTGNVHSATFFPVDEGAHSVLAHVQWGETSYSKSCTFQVLSPDPESDFTVYPTETYLGNMVTLSLNPYSSNPNANITVQSMTFSGRPLGWSIQSNPTTGLQMYVATSTTESNATGTNIARVQYTDNFGNVKNEEASVRLKTPVVSITGFNITPRIGSQPQAYTPISFEVTLDKNTIPSGIVPSGEITISEWGDTPRAQVTIPLIQDDVDSHVLHSQRDWLPPKEGTYSVAANAVLPVGAFTFSDREEEVVEVFPAAIDITLDSSPVSLERITVGRQIDLEFSVFGVPASDEIHSFQYAIFQGETIFVETKTLKVSDNASAVYKDSLDPFLEAGAYRLVATVTTIAPAVKSKSWNFSVLPSEIRKKVFYMNENSNQLFFGKPMDFTLELENPNDISDLGIKMFLVDENKNRIMDIDPEVGIGNLTSFQNERPFYLYESCTFTVAASVSIPAVPQIDLPTMYGDTNYFMPPPNAAILVDDSKEFLVGFAGAVDVTVTVPQGMQIQTPVLSIDPLWGQIDPTPYSATTTNDVVKYYRFKFTPTLQGSPVIHFKVYDSTDLSQVNPFLTRSATFSAVPFNPTIRITSVGPSAFIQGKQPEVKMEFSQVPDFFEGTFVFSPNLNGFTIAPVSSNQSVATASFSVQSLFDLLGIDAAQISVEANAVGNESFVANGAETFDVDLPSISNLRFPSDVLDKQFYVFEDSTLRVLFNNDRLLADPSLFEVRVDIEGNPNPYRAEPIFDPMTIPASASIENVIFSIPSPTWATPSIYCLNVDPPALLATGPSAQLNVYTSTQRVDIIQPSTTEKLYVGDEIKPVVRLTRIPPVVTGVALAIWEEGASSPKVQRNLIESTDGDWIPNPLDPKIKFQDPTKITMVATATSNPSGVFSTSQEFEVIQGELVITGLARSDDAGSLLFRDEKIGFLLEYTYDNRNLVPQSRATLTHVDTNTPYTITRESRESTPTTPTEYWEQWNAEPNTLASGKYILEAAVLSGPASATRQTPEFQVLQVISLDASSASIAPSSLGVGDSIYGCVEITLPGDFSDVVPDPDIQTYLNGSVRFPNCTSVGTNHRLFTDPSGNKVWFIEATGTAYEHSGASETPRTFYASFSVNLDSKEILNTQIPFTITNPVIP